MLKGFFVIEGVRSFVNCKECWVFLIDEIILF